MTGCAARSRARGPAISAYRPIRRRCAATQVTPKFISQADPASRWTGANKGAAFFAYATNYLIDLDHAVNNHSPPRKRPAYVPRPAPGKQSGAIVKRLGEYDQRAAIIADFEEEMSDLVPEASASRYEEALAALGGYLGFDAERPEKVHGMGPDVLWRTEAAFDFVTEAKSEKDEENPLYKKDHAQLLEAEHWFKQAYPGRDAVRVSALPEAIADEKATPAGSFAFRLDEITKVVSALRGVLVDLVGAAGGPEALRERCEAALVKAKLKPAPIHEAFMKPFGKAKPNKGK